MAKFNPLNWSAEPEQFVLTLITTLGFFGVLGYILIAGGIPEQGIAHDIVLSLVASLTTVWVLQQNHFFRGLTRPADEPAKSP